MKLPLIVIAACLALAAGTAPAADVEALYKKECASCHAADGSGSTKAGKLAGAKDLRDPKVQAEATDEKAFKSIREGIKDKDGTKFKMKPIKDATDADIKALVAYLRKFAKK